MAIKEVNVDTDIGKFVMVKAKAGPRNQALRKAGGIETDANALEFIFTLIPHTIKSHPFEPRNFDERGLAGALDDMETDDYDLLMDGFKDLYAKDLPGDAEKKSEQSSEEPKSVPAIHSNPTSK